MARPIAASILAGRAHLAKCEAVHTAFASSPLQHVAIDCVTNSGADYPADGMEEFRLPTKRYVADITDDDDVAACVYRTLEEIEPDVCLVYGDVDASVAALAAVQEHRVRLVHIESGYRSDDPNDHEERNRIRLSHAADIRVAHSAPMVERLLDEGIPEDSILLYGDPALLTLRSRLQRGTHLRPPPPSSRNGYGVASFHRLENLRSPERLRTILGQLRGVARSWPLEVILYGETRRALTQHDLLTELLAIDGIDVVRTLRYSDYVELLSSATFVVTDSSGLQDEAAFLRVPCFVLRAHTPRCQYVGENSRLVPDLERIVLAEVIEKELANVIQSSGWDEALLGNPYDEAFLARIMTTRR